MPNSLAKAAPAARLAPVPDVPDLLVRCWYCGGMLLLSALPGHTERCPGPGGLRAVQEARPCTS